MAGSMYAVVGCADSSGVFPRLEIRDLADKPENKYMWSLFTRALNKMQENGYKPDAVSFRQIGYIHGLPNQQWSGDVDALGKSPVLKKHEKGYCFHRLPQFPMWHRVHCLLMEQAIFNEAKIVAAKDIKAAPNQRTEWESAADQLRLPFWDSAGDQVSQPEFPKVLKEKKIWVTTGDGGEEIKNPLAFYRIGPPPPEFLDDPKRGRYFKSWERTYRCPKGTRDEKSNEEQYGIVERRFSKGCDTIIGEELLGPLLGIFQYPFPKPDSKPDPFVWNQFSNQSGGNLTINLENPHGNVHSYVGENGHFGDNDYSGLDPIFCLHHANVDRYLAYWESIYFQYWMTDTDEKEPLAPFRKVDGTYWTSADARFLHSKKDGPKLHYTYPAVRLPSPIKDVGPGPLLDVSVPPTSSCPRGDILHGLQHLFKQKIHAISKGSVILPPFVPATRNGLRVQAPASGVGIIATADAAAIEHSAGDGARSVSADNAAFAAPQPQPETEEQGVVAAVSFTGLKAPFFDATPTVGQFTSDNHRNKSRRIVVGVALQEHAFQGSYLLRLFLKRYADFALGSVAVFTRSSPSACPSCVRRDAEGAIINGAIFISSKIVEGLLEEGGLNEQDASDVEVLTLLKSSFSAKLEITGDLVAQTDEHAIDGISTLSEDVAPKLTLMSAWRATCVRHDHGEHDFLHEWENHGPLTTGAWVRV